MVFFGLLWCTSGCREPSIEPECPPLDPPMGVRPRPEPTPLRVLDGPTLRQFESVPLAALLTVSSDAPSRLVAVIESDEEAFQVRWPELATRHEVPLLGLKPDRRWTIGVWLLDERDHAMLAGTLTMRTPPLPDAFPEVEILAHHVDCAEPGYRLLDVNLVSDKLPSWLVAFDIDDFEVAWYQVGPPSFQDVRRTPAGTLVGLREDPIEVDLLDRTIRRWTPNPHAPADRQLPVSNAHHELFVMEDGTLLTLSEDVRQVPAYPDSYGAPDRSTSAARILASRVIRFDDAGTLLWDWSLADRLDIGRIGFDSLDWKVSGPDLSGFDWDHANAVIPHPDGGVIVSLRHQDVLVHLDAQGQLAWLLGDPSGWSPAFAPLLLQPDGPLQWPYHAHAPELTKDGLLLLFDNHNEGHTPYTPPPAASWHSRVVAFQIDEAARTVQQVWSFVPEGPELRSMALGDADLQPETGNVLALFGQVGFEDGVPNQRLGRGAPSVRLVEFAPGPPHTTLVDVRLSTPPNGSGLKTHRAETLPSLYADDVVVERLER